MTGEEYMNFLLSPAPNWYLSHAVDVCVPDALHSEPRIAVASRHAVYVYTAETFDENGDERACIKYVTHIDRAHTPRVSAVKFVSPEVIATAGADGFVRTWRVECLPQASTAASVRMYSITALWAKKLDSCCVALGALRFAARLQCIAAGLENGKLVILNCDTGNVMATHTNSQGNELGNKKRGSKAKKSAAKDGILAIDCMVGTAVDDNLAAVSSCSWLIALGRDDGTVNILSCSVVDDSVPEIGIAVIAHLGGHTETVTGVTFSRGIAAQGSSFPYIFLYSGSRDCTVRRYCLQLHADETHRLSADVTHANTLSLPRGQKERAWVCIGAHSQQKGASLWHFELMISGLNGALFSVVWDTDLEGNGLGDSYVWNGTNVFCNKAADVQMLKSNVAHSRPVFHVSPVPLPNARHSFWLTMSMDRSLKLLRSRVCSDVSASAVDRSVHTAYVLSGIGSPASCLEVHPLNAAGTSLGDTTLGAARVAVGGLDNCLRIVRVQRSVTFTAVVEHHIWKGMNNVTVSSVRWCSIPDLTRLLLCGLSDGRVLLFAFQTDVGSGSYSMYTLPKQHTGERVYSLTWARCTPIHKTTSTTTTTADDIDTNSVGGGSGAEEKPYRCVSALSCDGKGRVYRHYLEVPDDTTERPKMSSTAVEVDVKPSVDATVCEIECLEKNAGESDARYALGFSDGAVSIARLSGAAGERSTLRFSTVRMIQVLGVGKSVHRVRLMPDLLPGFVVTGAETTVKCVDGLRLDEAVEEDAGTNDADGHIRVSPVEPFLLCAPIRHHTASMRAREISDDPAQATKRSNNYRSAASHAGVMDVTVFVKWDSETAIPVTYCATGGSDGVVAVWKLGALTLNENGGGVGRAYTLPCGNAELVTLYEGHAGARVRAVGSAVLSSPGAGDSMLLAPTPWLISSSDDQSVHAWDFDLGRFRPTVSLKNKVLGEQSQSAKPKRSTVPSTASAGAPTADADEPASRGDSAKDAQHIASGRTSGSSTTPPTASLASRDVPVHPRQQSVMRGRPLADPSHQSMFNALRRSSTSRARSEWRTFTHSVLRIRAAFQENPQQAGELLLETCASFPDAVFYCLDCHPAVGKLWVHEAEKQCATDGTPFAFLLSRTAVMDTVRTYLCTYRCVPSWLLPLAPSLGIDIWQLALSQFGSTNRLSAASASDSAAATASSDTPRTTATSVPRCPAAPRSGSDKVLNDTRGSAGIGSQDECGVPLCLDGKGVVFGDGLHWKAVALVLSHRVLEAVEVYTRSSMWEDACAMLLANVDTLRMNFGEIQTALRSIIQRRFEAGGACPEETALLAYCCGEWKTAMLTLTSSQKGRTHGEVYTTAVLMGLSGGEAAFTRELRFCLPILQRWLRLAISGRYDGLTIGDVTAVLDRHRSWLWPLLPMHDRVALAVAAGVRCWWKAVRHGSNGGEEWPVAMSEAEVWYERMVEESKARAPGFGSPMSYALFTVLSRVEAGSDNSSDYMSPCADSAQSRLPGDDPVGTFQWYIRDACHRVADVSATELSAFAASVRMSVHGKTNPQSSFWQCIAQGPDEGDGWVLATLIALTADSALPLHVSAQPFCQYIAERPSLLDVRIFHPIVGSCLRSIDCRCSSLFTSLVPLHMVEYGWSQREAADIRAMARALMECVTMLPPLWADRMVNIEVWKAIQKQISMQRVRRSLQTAGQSTQPPPHEENDGALSSEERVAAVLRMLSATSASTATVLDCRLDDLELAANAVRERVDNSTEVSVLPSPFYVCRVLQNCLAALSSEGDGVGADDSGFHALCVDVQSWYDGVLERIPPAEREGLVVRIVDHR